MTFIVEDGTGKDNAESYISVADADAYITKWHGSMTAWDGLDESGKQIALRKATRYIDSFSYMGARTFASQALSWPRVGIGLVDGQYYAVNVIPRKVVSGTMEAVIKYVEGENLFPNHYGASIQSEGSTVGPLADNVSYFTGKQPEKVFESINKLIRPFFSGSRHTLERGVG